jgi:hypothetical protein
MKTLCVVLAGTLGLTLVGAAQAQVIQRKIQIQPGKIQIQPGKIQIQPGGGGRLIAPALPANPLGLLESKDVRKDLKLSDEQIKKLDELSGKFKEATKDLKGRDLIVKGRELAASIQKEVNDSLKPEQGKRLKQLQVQQKGVGAFLDPIVAKELELSPDQQTTVRAGVKDVARKRAEILRETKGDRDAMAKKLAEVNKAMVAEIVKGLSDEQKKKWTEVAGAPFKGVFPAPAGFGGIIRPLPLPDVRPLPLPKKIERKIL